MDWIQKNLHKIQSQEQLQTNFIIGSIFQTKFHSILIDSTSKTKNTFLKGQLFKQILIFRCLGETPGPRGAEGGKKCEANPARGAKGRPSYHRNVPKT